MTRISKAFAAILQIVRNPWLLNHVLDNEKYWKDKVEARFNMQHGLPVIRPEEIFGDFTETVEPFAFLDGGSLPTDLALLKKLARRIPGCSYFEIGTWRGESVANVASVAGDCFSLNLSDQEMNQKGLDPRCIELHRFFSKDIPNITHLDGNTLSYDFQSLNRKFDLIFIDGDHHYEMVKNDTEKVFSHLVHGNTIVVWHDYTRDPETIRFDVMAGILDGCPEKYHEQLFHVAHTLCAVYLPGQHGGTRLDPPVEPKGEFRVDITYRKA